MFAASGTGPDVACVACRCGISRVHGFPSVACVTSQSAMAAPAAVPAAAAAERLGSAGTACTAGSAHERVPAEPRGHGTVSPSTAAAAATDDAEHASTPAECPCTRMEATLGLKQRSCWLHFKHNANLLQARPKQLLHPSMAYNMLAGYLDSFCCDSGIFDEHDK